MTETKMYEDTAEFTYEMRVTKDGREVYVAKRISK